jgi:hypothetical protein
MSVKGVDAATVTSLTAGDVVLMDRQCLRMKDPLSIGLCLGSKTVSRYDHVGMVYKATPETVAKYANTKRAIEKAGGLSPSGTYILEANVGGVTLRSMEARLGRTSSNQIAVRPLVLPASETPAVLKAMDEAVNETIVFDYKTNLMDFVSMSLKPPDKLDRMTAAAKRIVLEKEIDLIHSQLRKDITLDASATRLLIKLERDYAEAVGWLDKTYFPRDRNLTFFVDGENNSGSSKGVFCSELLVHVWQRCGVVSIFPPSTSFAPVDFDRWDDEFSFSNEGIGMGAHRVIFPTSHDAAVDDVVERTHARDGVVDAELTGEAFLRARLTVLRNLHLESNTEVANVDQLMSQRDELAFGRSSVLPTSWMIQSSTHYQLCRDMPERIVLIGALFSIAGLAFAPWQLRSLEKQLGMQTLRGGLWSVGLGLAMRSLTATMIQAWMTYAIFRSYNRHQDDHRSVMKVMRCSEGAPLSVVADDRHPFYTCSAALIFCGAAAGSLTHCMETWTLHRYFGPDRPTSPSVRLLWRGVSMSCLSFTFSYGGAWLIWYECFGPLLFTTETSVFRRRRDQPRDDRWVTQQRDAMLGAMCITALVETVTYPMQSATRRRFLRAAYYPEEPPVRRVRLWSGCFRHLARSLGICASTGLVVWSLL